MPETQLLGKYQILEEIGRGGFATVYRALDTILEREVALKVLKPGWTDDAKAVERFMREARAASRLDQPGIVTIYDVGSADGRLFIAMKLLAGQSLDQLIKANGPLSWERTLNIVQQVAEALDYAHGKGLVHRDIKPSNIIVREDDRAVLTDFGLVRGAEQASLSTGSTGGILGTPEYIPPEVWEGQPATKASDIYALACVVYEMLLGRPLFAADTGAAVMRKHVLVGPEFPANWPPEVPSDVAVVLRKALAHEVSERYTSVGEFVSILRGLAVQEWISAQTATKMTVMTAKREHKKAQPLHMEMTSEPPRLRGNKKQITIEVLPILARRSKYVGIGSLILLLLVGIVMIGSSLIFGVAKPINTDISTIKVSASAPTFLAADSSPISSSIVNRTSMPANGSSNTTTLTKISSETFPPTRTSSNTPTRTSTAISTRTNTKTPTAISKPTSTPTLQSQYTGGARPLSKCGTGFHISADTFKGNTDIYIWTQLNSGNKVNLTNNLANDDSPCLSSDSKRVVFRSNRDGNDEIYLMDIDGAGLTRLTNNSSSDWGPIWSPDGTRIAFTSSRDGNEEIYVMNADGTGQANLTTSLSVDRLPIWSPNGSQIAFTSNRDGNYEVYVMNADGSLQVNLTKNPAKDSADNWSADGKLIFFDSNRDTASDTFSYSYVMGTDGSGQTRWRP